MLRPACIAALAATASACTNLLVSKGASADGSTQIAYNADAGDLYGSLGFYPAKKNPQGAKRDIWDWDGSFYLGSIPEANETYNVVGNVNEYGLIIGETTFGGLPQLSGAGTGAIMDYGSLIWVALQRAKTAREAIRVMDELVQAYGYASEGESFAIADPDEVWLLELIGKGKYSRGAVWVASKVPDGYVGSTANQARTRTFAQNDPDSVMYAADVVTFAQSIGLYPKDGRAEDFSFSDVYDPVSFTSARFCEARVFNLFNAVTDGGFAGYLDYAQGYNLTNRMPLFAKPSRPLSVSDTMRAMRTHFEDTWFDNTGRKRPDVGAGSGNSPYRWRPLTWSDPDSDDTYLNERTVGTQQTAWNFVATSRGWMPGPLRALMWWAPDDSSTGIRVPFYGSATRVPAGFADPVGQEPAAAVATAVRSDALTMSLDSAFWVWNLVSNMCYGERYADAYPVVLAEVERKQAQLINDTARADAAAAALFANGDRAGAIESLTNYSVTTADRTLQEWRDFWMTLFVRFRDGFTVGPSKQPQCDPKRQQKDGCTSRAVPDVGQSGYSAAWRTRIINDSDNKKRYRVPSGVQLDQRKLAVIDKRRRN